MKLYFHYKYKNNNIFLLNKDKNKILDLTKLNYMIKLISNNLVDYCCRILHLRFCLGLPKL